MAADVNVGRVNAFLTLDTRRFTSGLRRAESSLKRTSQRLTSIGKQAAFVLAAPLVGAGVAIVKAAAEFEEEMTKIQTLVGVNKELVDEWRESVEDLSLSVAVGPRELAKALFVVTSAGIRGAESLEILEQAAKAATVGLGETKEVARAVTSAVQAFASSGLSAKSATEILVATVREGNLEASSLASSLGRVLAIASQVGASFAQVGAFIATFTRLGVSAEEAVTALRGAFAALLKPSNEGRIALARVSKANDGVAKTFADLRAEISTKGLAPTLVGLIDLFKGQEEQLVKVIPRIRALAGILAVASSQAEVFLRIEKKVAESLGILDEAFAVAEKEASVAFRRIGISIELFRVKVGKVLLPAAKEIADTFTRLITEFASLDPAVIQTALKFTVLAVGLTGLTIALGLAAQALAFIGAGLLALGSFLISPIAVIGALATAIGLLALSFSDVGQSIRTKLVVSLGGIGAIFDDFLTSIEIALVSGAIFILAPLDAIIDGVSFRVAQLGRLIVKQSNIFREFETLGNPAFAKALRITLGVGVTVDETDILDFITKRFPKLVGELSDLVGIARPEVGIEVLGPFIEKNKKILAQAAADIANERTGIIAEMNALLAGIVNANLDRTEALKKAADKRSAIIKAAADEEAGIIESSQLAIKALIEKIKVAALIPIEPGEFAERVGRDVTALRGFLKNLQFGQKEATKETELFLEVMRKMGLVAEPTIEAVAEAFEGLAKQTQLKLPLKDRLTEAAEDAIADIESQIKAIEIEIELVGVGQAVADAKRLENAVEELGKEGELRGIKDGGDLLDELRVKAVRTSLALSRAKGFEDLTDQLDALRLTAKELDLTPAQRSVNKLVKDMTELAIATGALTTSQLPALEEEIRSLAKTIEDSANRVSIAIGDTVANALGTMFDGFLRGTLDSISALEVFRNLFLSIITDMFVQSLKQKLKWDLIFKKNIFALTADVGKEFLKLVGILSTPIEPEFQGPPSPFPNQFPEQSQGPPSQFPEVQGPPTPAGFPLPGAKDPGTLAQIKLPDSVGEAIGRALQGIITAGVLREQSKPGDVPTAQGAQTTVGFAAPIQQALTTPGLPGGFEGGGGLDVASQVQPVIDELVLIVEEITAKLRELIAVIDDALQPLKQSLETLNEELKLAGEEMRVGNEELKSNFQQVNTTMEQGTAKLKTAFDNLVRAIHQAQADLQRQKQASAFTSAASAGSGGGGGGGAGAGATGGIISKEMNLLVGEAGPELLIPQSKFGDFSSLKELASQLSLPMLAEGAVVTDPTIAIIGEKSAEIVLPVAKASKLLGSDSESMSATKIATKLELPKLADGAIVNKPTIALIGEAGPEAVVPLAKVPPSNRDGGGDVTIQIFNSTGEPATTEETTGADGHRIVKVMVGRVVADDLNRGGAISQSFENTFGLNRRGLRR